MSKRKLQVKTGDTVMIIAGKDKGKTGKIIAAQPAKDRVIVEGPNQANPQGGIITKEAPIHVSNVMVIDPKTKEPSRIKKVQQKDGSYVRATVKSDSIIDNVK